MNMWRACKEDGAIIGQFQDEARAQRWADVWNEANGCDTAYVEEVKRK